MQSVFPQIINLLTLVGEGQEHPPPPPSQKMFFPMEYFSSYKIPQQELAIKKQF